MLEFMVLEEFDGYIVLVILRYVFKYRDVFSLENWFRFMINLMVINNILNV